MSSYHIGEAHKSSPMDTAPSAFSLQPRPSLEYTASHSSRGKILNYHFQYFTIFTTFQEIICIERAVLGLGDYLQLINLPMATRPRMMANTLRHRLPITSIHERPVGNGGAFFGTTSKPECSSRPSERKPFLPVQACLVHQEIEQIHGDNAFLIT